MVSDLMQADIRTAIEAVRTAAAALRRVEVTAATASPRIRRAVLCAIGTSDMPNGIVQELERWVEPAGYPGGAPRGELLIILARLEESTSDD